MHIKSPSEIHDLVTNILMAVGTNKPNASRVADGLVSSHLAGVDPHGIWHLDGYVRDVKKGFIDANATPEILNESASSALVTGNWTFGFITAKYAMELGIKKAQDTGLSVVGIVRTTHIGRLGEYVEMAAEKDMISMIWAGGYSEDQQTTFPHGGAKPVLHTNPLAMGFPAGKEVPMIIDFATTTMSGSKVDLHRNRGEQVPPNSIVDKNAMPTTNPEDFFNGGGHLPFGGHKGYAIMLAVETLGRIFTGADSYAEAHRGGIYNRHQGISIMVLKADLFQPLDGFKSTIDELEQRMRAIPPAPNFSEVIVPGDIESRTRKKRASAIDIPDDVWEMLEGLAKDVGVELN